MLLATLSTALLFFVSVFGLAWPLAARLALDPAEKLIVAVLLSLLGIWLVAWSVYVFALPSATLWGVPILGLLHLILGRQSLALVGRDAGWRDLASGQLIVTGWCLGWLALIVSYSGGDWLGDWFGHWDRSRFFIERWPRDFLFTGFDPLTSRPPLANVVTGAFLQLTRLDFAHYQVVMTLLNSLAFLPAALLARRFGGPSAARILVAVIMLNPLFVQNATYAWTKLPVVFFVLTALYFFLRAHEANAWRGAGILCAASLAAGLLAHYSAGPYVVLLVFAWLALGWPRRRDSRWWKSTALAAAVGTALLTTWFGWSLTVYGPRQTFLTNTSITDRAPTRGQEIVRIARNLRNTVVPHFARTVDWKPYTQQSPWGRWRDWFFLLYQRNLFFAAGSVAWLLIVIALWRKWRPAALRDRVFWTGFALGAFVLGVAAYSGDDPWGNMPLCEQPLVLLALAFLASQWRHFSRGWRRLLIVGAAIDLLAGIVLQFGVQSHLFDRWLTPERSPAEYFSSYTEISLMNLRAKHHLAARFFSESLGSHPALALALVGALLLLAVTRARRPTLNPTD